MTTKTIVTTRTAMKTQTLAAMAAVGAAVALPQLLHIIGAVSGLGPALGQTFLPMYLPIILVGFLVGPFAGAAAGIAAPLLSFALTGMPGVILLPIIMTELVVIGFAAGMLRSLKLPSFGKLILVQLAGKAAYALAVLAAIYLFGSTLEAGQILASVQIGLPGLLLQWALVPLILFRVENRKLKEEE
jgi:hypothetical protein